MTSKPKTPKTTLNTKLIVACVTLASMLFGAGGAWMSQKAKLDTVVGQLVKVQEDLESVEIKVDGVVEKTSEIFTLVKVEKTKGEALRRELDNVVAKVERIGP